jgi:hypothetical protein
MHGRLFVKISFVQKIKPCQGVWWINKESKYSGIMSQAKCQTLIPEYF